MKIAIHNFKGSFSDRWIQYCKKNSVCYKVVDCYDSNIISQLKDCDGLMWHWDQNDYKASLFARQLTISLETQNFKVFPNANSSWHHDDKLGQKYLLESIGAPLVNSYAFYSRKEALAWLTKTTFPKVFKLRGGAGSVNVRMVETKQQAERLVNKAFSSGFTHINRISRLKDRFWVLRRDRSSKAIRGVLSGFARMVFPTEVEKYSTKEKGYIYFQDFIPKNDFDTRLVVIGDRCFGVRRYCRKGDFRASGSGIKAYKRELFDQKAVSIAFETAGKLNTQSLALDFIIDRNDSGM